MKFEVTLNDDGTFNFQTEATFSQKLSLQSLYNELKIHQRSATYQRIKNLSSELLNVVNEFINPCVIIGLTISRNNNVDITYNDGDESPLSFFT